ncbi:MAG: phage integrase, partial [Alphaproteobacteria bacterium]|nr:phage integrase [Alphaproteobacteria bacterium]
MKLNDRLCKNALPGDKARKLADGGGLYLEVTSSGSKYWRLKYRFGGKENRLALGVYPVVGLKEAREKALAAKRGLDAGIDPSRAKRSAKLAQRFDQSNSFEAVARAWHEHHKVKWSPNTANNNIHRLEADIFPVIGPLPIKEISLKQLLVPLHRIEARGAPDMARRCFSLCNQVFRYAVVQDIINRNPAANIKPTDVMKPYKKGNFAAIDAKQLPDFVKNLRENKARLFPTTL